MLPFKKKKIREKSRPPLSCAQQTTQLSFQDLILRSVFLHLKRKLLGFPLVAGVFPLLKFEVLNLSQHLKRQAEFHLGKMQNSQLQ